MTRASHTRAEPQYVAVPRMCDAVGNALRDAYRGSGATPDYLARLLDKLNDTARR